MTDIASYIQSDWSWAILFVTALFVGMSKTGIQGLTLLTVPLLALAIDACAIPFVLMGAYLGIRLVKILPERGFRIFTTTVTVISVLVMLLV